MERYAFFLNNRCNLLAESNEEKNILSGFRSGAVVKTITESQFLNARNLKSELILNEGIVEEVLIDDQLFLNNPEKNLQEAKDKIKNTIAIFLPLLEQYCNSHENDTYWHDYKKKLEDIISEHYEEIDYQ